MKTDLICTRIDHGTKVKFNQVCEDIGLSPSQAIKLFAMAVINHGRIPFELRKLPIADLKIIFEVIVRFFNK